MSDTSIRWTARSILAASWLAIVLALIVSRTPKYIAMSAFGLFRMCAVLGVLYLLYESHLVTEKRSSGAALALDSLVVFSMFLFWFAVAASTF